ncbi:MAG: hypothetical protein U9N59_15985 [Campylobacterota bacterium]|nr:hypothetical protein [Campylobacterota bacterium]
MNEELKEIFKVCDTMFENTTIDFKELLSKQIDVDFFEDYTNTRLVNSFLFNFSKLQDKIGAKLFRKVLYELKEIDDINMPMIDILNRLEKLSIIEDIRKWDELREIRNSIAHEYPFEINERVENIKLAMVGFEMLEGMYNKLKVSSI